MHQFIFVTNADYPLYWSLENSSMGGPGLLCCRQHFDIKMKHFEFMNKLPLPPALNNFLINGFILVFVTDMHIMWP